MCAPARRERRGGAARRRHRHSRTRARGALADRRRGDRHRRRRRRGDRHHCDDRGRAGFAAWDATPVEARAAALTRAGDAAREEPRAPDRALCSRRAARPSTMRVAEVREAVDYLPLLRGRGAGAALRRRRCPGRPARARYAAVSWPRRLRLHQPVEFSARDLHRPDHGRTRRRQCGGGETRRADAARRRRSGAPVSPRGHSGDGAASRPRRRHCRRLSRRPSRRRRRRLHRLDRGRPHHQPDACRKGRPDRSADRRDRRHQCDDRRCHRAARAGDRRRRHFGLPFGRPALLGAAALCLQEDIADRVIDMVAGAAASLPSAIPATSPPMSAR